MNVITVYNYLTFVLEINLHTFSVHMYVHTHKHTHTHTHTCTQTYTHTFLSKYAHSEAAASLKTDDRLVTSGTGSG